MKNTLENFFIVWYSTPCVNVPIAQLVEHRTLNPQVVGSIPTGDTICKMPFMYSWKAFYILVITEQINCFICIRDRIGVANLLRA